MGLLSKEEVAYYALRHGKVFSHVCDSKDCGRLIAAGELCVVLKSQKRTDGLTFLGAIPIKVRCMVCERDLHPPSTKEVAVKGAGRGAKKVAPEVAAKLTINPVVRRAVLSILKAHDGQLTTQELLVRLRTKRSIREVKKREVGATLRAMRKLKLVKVKAKKWCLPVIKATKQRKKRTKKVLAK